MFLEQSVEVYRLASHLDRHAERGFAPGLGARIAARVRGRQIDRALIEGADPARSARLAARAARLTERGSRVAVAEGLERWLDGCAGRGHLTVTPNRRAIDVNRAELSELVAMLRAPVPVYARGVAMVRRLLSDGTGVAYCDRDGVALRSALRDARLAIDGCRRAAAARQPVIGSRP